MLSRLVRLARTANAGPAAARAAAVIIGLIVLGGAPGARQDASPRPQFRSTANFIQVDVSVLDRDRRPVRGLTAADFAAFENGVRQEVLAFKEIDVPDPAPPPIAWMRDVAPDVKSNIAASDGRLVVLVLDDGIAGLDLYARKVREIGRRIVDRLGPRDQAAVIFTMGIKKSSDFTSDRTRLLATIDQFAPGFVVNGPENAAVCFTKVAEFLADAPQRRKAIIYISPGWPIDFLNPDNPEAETVKRWLDDAFDKAGRSNVNIYSIDPSGLTDEAIAGSEAQLAEGVMTTVVNGAFPPLPTVSAHDARALSHDFLLTLAEHTGGRAIINNNEFASGVTQIFDETSSYYLLGYRSADERTDGKFRRIEVRVGRPDLMVHARTGYDAPKPEKANTRPVSPLVTALSGILPSSDIAMQVAVAPFAIPGKKEVALAVALALRQPAPTEAKTDDVGLLVSAYDAQGDPHGSQRYAVSLKLRPTGADRVQDEMLVRIDLKPGRYQLRLAATSSLQGKSGSLYYEVEVPDFSKPAVSLSGVVVHAEPAVASAPKGGLPAVVPVVPTARRDFWAADVVTAFARVYEGGGKPLVPVRVTGRVVDIHGEAVYETEQTLTPDQFSASRAADYRLELPMAKFPVGPYVLTIEATAASTPPVRRDVRFDVR
jgi:VWFA-related protein